MYPMKYSIVVAIGIAWAFGSCAYGQSSAQFHMPVQGKLPVARQMHGTAVVGKRLYVIGGNGIAGWSKSVSSAPILDDGSIGAFGDEGDLPDRRSYLMNSVEVANDHIYVTCGLKADNYDSSESTLLRPFNVLYTKVRADGGLEGWRQSEALPGQPMALGASMSNNRNLFYTGGSAKSYISDNVIMGDLSADGEPQNWRIIGKMPTPLWFHGAAVLKDKIYLWGGITSLNRQQVNANVYCATLLSDDTLGPWQTLEAMASPTYAASSCAFNDYLISVGGRYVNGYPTNDVLFTRITPTGLERWTVMQTDLETRAYHALGLDKNRGWVFIAGGKKILKPGPGGIDNLVNAIQAFQLSQPTAPKTLANLDSAQQTAKSLGKPCLVFFYSNEVPLAKRVWDTVIKSPEFMALADKYVLAAEDVSTPAGELQAQKCVIYKVPSLALLSPDGTLLQRTTQVDNMTTIRQELNIR